MPELQPLNSPDTIAAVAADLHRAALTGRNARTVRAYAGDYADFGKFLVAPSPAAALDTLVTMPHGLANACALAYRGHLIARGLAASTVRRRLAALKSAVKLARQLGRCAWALEVEAPEAQAYRDTRGPGADGWRRLLDAAKAAALDGSARARRDLALLRLMHDLALRRAEVVGLDLADVELSAGRLHVVRKGKTAAEPITMPPPVVSALTAWIQTRGDQPGPLFTRGDRPGSAERLTGRGVAKVVARLSRRAGLSHPARPHGLRHAGITRALDVTGGDVRAVRRFSGHAKLDTLIVYDDARQDLRGQVARLVSED